MAKKGTDDTPTILVVDDDIGVREAFSEMLISKGYRVQLAAEANSAAKIVSKQKIDLALVDIWLKPGIDGIELIKRWRESGQLSFPVAIVSGHAEVPTAVQAMRHGAMDVLTKPINSKLLLDFVATALSSRRATSGEQAVHTVSLGTLPEMITLKGKLLRATTHGNLTLLVGARQDGCELFARLLLPGTRRLHELRDVGFLTYDPTMPLTRYANDACYLRGLNEMSEAQQHGLYQLTHQALNRDMMVLVESSQSVKELQDAGRLIPDLSKILADVEVTIPALDSYADSLAEIVSATAHLLALEHGRPANAFTSEALERLAAEVSRWKQVGLTGLLGAVHTLLQSTPRGAVTAAHVTAALYSDSTSIEDKQTALFSLSLRDARNQFEQLYLQNLLKRTHNNFVEAAKIAKMERSYLYRKVSNLLSKSEQDEQQG